MLRLAAPKPIYRLRDFFALIAAASAFFFHVPLMLIAPICRSPSPPMFKEYRSAVVRKCGTEHVIQRGEGKPPTIPEIAVCVKLLIFITFFLFKYK